MTATGRALGLMSGTSLDGIDAAIIETDGVEVSGFGSCLFEPYREAERQALRRALASARGLARRDARPPPLVIAERIVTERHIAVVERLLARAGLAAADVDVVGFHGQTVFHDPGAGITIQLGDGQRLATAIGIPVVHDLRAADIAAGGQGAPLVPVYHRALAERFGIRPPAVIANIGGVANITVIAADGTITACDSGPGNALLDDFMRARTGAAMDEDGRHAGAGTIDGAALARLCDDPYFARPPPKSLDRDHFTTDFVDHLATADGAATLCAFTATTLAAAITRFAGAAARVVVSGGGARNPVLMRMLGERLPTPPCRADEVGWSVEFAEAQAFAYLAMRSRRKLPLTFPGTTGVARPLTGGVTALPRRDRRGSPGA